jgi:hypothetical protein
LFKRKKNIEPVATQTSFSGSTGLLTTTELLKKVRELEIKSRKITTHLFTGEYHSAFKGQGMSLQNCLKKKGNLP